MFTVKVHSRGKVVEQKFPTAEQAQAYADHQKRVCHKKSEVVAPPIASDVKPTKKRLAFAKIVQEEMPGAKVLARKEVMRIVQKHGIHWPSWLTSNKHLRSGRGKFQLPEFAH